MLFRKVEIAEGLAVGPPSPGSCAAVWLEGWDVPLELDEADVDRLIEVLQEARS